MDFVREGEVFYVYRLDSNQVKKFVQEVLSSKKYKIMSFERVPRYYKEPTGKPPIRNFRIYSDNDDVYGRLKVVGKRTNASGKEIKLVENRGCADPIATIYSGIVLVDKSRLRKKDGLLKLLQEL